MKKLFSIISVCLLLTGCGKTFTCDMCNQEKHEKGHEITFWGQKGTVCNECYKEIQKMKEEMFGK